MEVDVADYDLLDYAGEAIPGDPATGAQSIHDEKSIQFYKENLKADKWVIDTLTQMHCIPFKSDPPLYFEQNNISAKKEKKALWDKMIEWETGGYVSRVPKRPTCTSPMSVIIYYGKMQSHLLGEKKKFTQLLTTFMDERVQRTPTVRLKLIMMKFCLLLD